MNRLIVAVAIPIVALFGWFASIEIGLQIGTKVRIDIQGYDPRDLLSGHYVQFTLKTLGTSPCSERRSSVNSCLCLAPSATDTKYSAVWGGDCDNKPSNCTLFIKGACTYGRFESGANRYYVPEHFEKIVRTTPPNSSIDVVISSNGTAVVENFYVGEETLEQYAQRIGTK